MIETNPPTNRFTQRKDAMSMTKKQFTVGTIVTHAIIGCEWKVVCGDVEYSLLKPFDNEAVSYMDSRDNRRAYS